MFLPRIIPVLLLKSKGLVKTIKFNKSRYIGDPINAVRIFNDLKADELVFLDILATIEKRIISMDLVKNIGDEAFMPFSVGGGVSNVEQIEQLLKTGAEKVIINSHAMLNPKLIEEASRIFGSQSIVVSLDIKKSLFGKYQVWIKSGMVNTKMDPIQAAKMFQELGAGELIINSIDQDGMMKGYEINLLKSVSEKVSIPTVALGGAGSLNDLKTCYYEGGVHALAAGSLFVYHGPRNAVLINYPLKEEITKLFT